MHLFRARRLLLAGATALSLGLGMAGLLAEHQVGTALAQDDYVDLDGVVEQMPQNGLVGTWQVSGKTVQVTDATAIDQDMGKLGVGVPVEVEGATQPDGSITATEIEVADQHGT
jgi:Domain of unknown function (DUF5666)